MGMPAKISPPRLGPVYRRERLLEWLSAAQTSHAAVCISGPPGAGKTVLAADYVASSGWRAIWYRFDSGDDRLAAFLAYLARAAHPLLQPDAAPPLPPEGPVPGNMEAFCRAWFRQLYDALQAPFVLVLDDYQEAPPDSPVHVAVRMACEEMPHDGHLLILGRERRPQGLAHLQLGGTLAVLDPACLAVDDSELQGIAALRGIALDAGEAAALQAQADGWMAGTLLLLEEKRLLDAGLSGGEAPARVLAEYFGTQVVDPLEARDRAILLQCALLPRLSAAQAGLLTGSPEAGLVLRELVRQHHFVSVEGADAPVYRFHSLFRRFLLDACRSRHPPEEYATLCRRAAQMLAGEDPEAALCLLEQARDWQGMTQAILAAAPQLRERLGAAALAGWIARLPAGLGTSSPWLLYWRAAGSGNADPDHVLVLLAQAWQQFGASGDHAGLACCWAATVEEITALRRDFRQLDGWLADFDARLASHYDALPPLLQARLTAGMAAALAFRQPDRPDRESWLERMRALLESERHAGERERLRRLLVLARLARGELAESHIAQGLFRETVPPYPALSYAEALAEQEGEAALALMSGLEQRCLQAIATGLALARQTPVRDHEPLLLCHGAMMSLNRGDLARADGFLALFGQLPSALQAAERGYYHAAAAWRKFQGGEPALALRLCQQANAEIHVQGQPWMVAASHLGAGLLHYLCGKTEEARIHLETGRHAGAAIGNPLADYAYHLFAAHIAFEEGREEQGRALLAAGMGLGAARGYLHFLFFPPRIIARLCCRALQAGIEPDHARALIEHNRLGHDPSWGHCESWPWALRIYTLGRFAVVRSGTPIQFAGKSQKKPLELLRALIALGGREVPEARLADLLWPDAEGDAGAQALATTLFRLRKLTGEQAIRRQDNRLTLDPAICWVDCWAFERLCSQMRSDPASLAQLERLYQGPFLDGEEGAAWIRPMRERLQARHARLPHRQAA